MSDGHVAVKGGDLSNKKHPLRPSSTIVLIYGATCIVAIITRALLDRSAMLTLAFAIPETAILFLSFFILGRLILTEDLKYEAISMDGWKPL
jgi:hypothetical protein